MWMAKEQRLIDANAMVALEDLHYEYDPVRDGCAWYRAADVWACIENEPTVDAVEIPDKKLLRAVKLLLKQYEHSKNSDYVHSPVAHAFFHTWKQLDERRK
jgi:hypothetical protein